MKTKVQFPSGRGHQLAGILHLPPHGEPRAYAIFAHCFSCTKDIKAANKIAGTLAGQGIATLRFDFAGLGASEGVFSDTNFSTNVEDLLSATQFLKDHYSHPQLLIGHSLGGTAVLEASKHLSDVRAVVTIGSPSTADHILHVLNGHLETLESEGEAMVSLGVKEHTFKQQFVEDVVRHVSDYSHLGKALLVMHAPLDQIVSVDEASKIFGQARHPKSFVSLDHADHLLSKTEYAVYAANVIVSWVAPYLTGQEVKQKSTSDDAPARGISVSGRADQGFVCTVKAGDHEFIMDEPASAGGGNLGPTPYDLLGAALAGCTVMTLNMYARLKKLNLSLVMVDVFHDRIHAEDCSDCEKTEGKIDRFTRRIELVGDLTPEQHKRVLEIADRCPVHRTLENEVKVETTRSDAS